MRLAIRNGHLLSKEPLAVAEECLLLRRKRPTRENTRDQVERSLHEQVMVVGAEEEGASSDGRRAGDRGETSSQAPRQRPGCMREGAGQAKQLQGSSRGGHRAEATGAGG